MLIFTDGSFSKKPKMAGMGAVIIDRDREFTVGNYSDSCRDNNVAEVAAIAMAIQYIRDKRIVDKTKDKTITIISDSQYALRRITGSQPGRSEFEQKCLDYIHDFLDETNKKVTFFQVKGHLHDGNKFSRYNNIADHIAGEYREYGLQLYRSQMNIIVNKKGKR